MRKILVTGGCGYIGSHTIVDLVRNGYEVISIDNNARSNPAILNGVEQITGKKIKNYKVDLCNFDDTFAVFQENTDISGIIHFAAFKAVGESVANPLLYFENNIVSLINLLKCVQEFHVSSFVFSSSCTVYGEPAEVPVTEQTTLRPAQSPYGLTKQMGEELVKEYCRNTACKSILLRYFNPAGAHPSILIGEMPVGKPQNLVPAITQTAAGLLPKMYVNGSDYSTRDGSNIRDYIHVCDIAEAHTLALKYMEGGTGQHSCEVFNLGSGNGITVLEAIHAFEKVSGCRLNYEIGPRRPGDVVAVYANNNLARSVLGWDPRYSLEDIMDSAWKWELKRKQEEMISRQQPDLN